MISLYAALAVLFACWVSMVWLAASYHRLLEETLDTLRQERERREYLERTNLLLRGALEELVRRGAIEVRPVDVEIETGGEEPDNQH